MYFEGHLTIVPAEGGQTAPANVAKIFQAIQEDDWNDPIVKAWEEEDPNGAQVPKRLRDLGYMKWEVVPEGKQFNLQHDGREKFRDWWEWLEWVNLHIVRKLGCRLSGTVRWSGESLGDCGTVSVTESGDLLSQEALFPVPCAKSARVAAFLAAPGPEERPTVCAWLLEALENLLVDFDEVCPSPVQERGWEQRMYQLLFEEFVDVSPKDVVRYVRARWCAPQDSDE